MCMHTTTLPLLCFYFLSMMSTSIMIWKEEGRQGKMLVSYAKQTFFVCVSKLRDCSVVRSFVRSFKISSLKGHGPLSYVAARSGLSMQCNPRAWVEGTPPPAGVPSGGTGALGSP